MQRPINVKSSNNIIKWQMGFNSVFKGLKAFLYLAPNKNEDKLHQRIFDVCQTIRNHSGILKGGNIS
jgi:hypothetical protein